MDQIFRRAARLLVVDPEGCVLLEGIVAANWWSLAEIETTSEQVFPEDLRERLREL